MSPWRKKSSESEYEEVWSDDYEVEDASIAFLNPSQPCFNKRGASYTPPGWKSFKDLQTIIYYNKKQSIIILHFSNQIE